MFGIPVADLTMPETIEKIGELVVSGRATGRSHQIATVNVDFLVNALDDPDTTEILQNATVCLADGMPVVWERVCSTCRSGSESPEPISSHCWSSPRCAPGTTSTSSGRPPEVADASRTILDERYPGAHFSIDPGPMIPDVEHVDDEVLDAIAAVDADIVGVALGNPKQERFIRAHQARLGTPVMIGVGGSLDLLVGKRRRAPGWVQRIGMEWVVRAAQEPGRLGRRYAHDIRVFAPRFIAELRANRRRRGGLGLRLAPGGNVVRVSLGGRDLPAATDWSTSVRDLLAGADLSIECEQDDVVRDAAVAAPRLPRRHHASGGRRRRVDQPTGRTDVVLRSDGRDAHDGRPQRSVGDRPR